MYGIGILQTNVNITKFSPGKNPGCQSMQILEPGRIGYYRQERHVSLLFFALLVHSKTWFKMKTVLRNRSYEAALRSPPQESPFSSASYSREIITRHQP